MAPNGHILLPTWAMNPGPYENPDCIQISFRFPSIWDNLGLCPWKQTNALNSEFPNAGLWTNADTGWGYQVRWNEFNEESFIQFNFTWRTIFYSEIRSLECKPQDSKDSNILLLCFFTNTRRILAHNRHLVSISWMNEGMDYLLSIVLRNIS